MSHQTLDVRFVPMTTGGRTMVAKIHPTSLSSDTDGRNYIGWDCAAPGEVDFLVDSLIADLEAIRKKAHAKLKVRGA